MIPKFLLKPLLPQLKKISGAIQEIEKDYSVPKARIVIENEVKDGKVEPILKLEGVMNGEVRVLQKNGVVAKFPIDKIVELLTGMKEEGEDDDE